MKMSRGAAPGSYCIHHTKGRSVADDQSWLQVLATSQYCGKPPPDLGTGDSWLSLRCAAASRLEIVPLSQPRILHVFDPMRIGMKRSHVFTNDVPRLGTDRFSARRLMVLSIWLAFTVPECPRRYPPLWPYDRQVQGPSCQAGHATLQQNAPPPVRSQEYEDVHTCRWQCCYPGM